MTNTHTANPAHETPTRRTIHTGSTEVEVARQAPAPTLRATTVDDEADYLSAFRDAASANRLPGMPPEGLARALARTSIDDPTTTTTRIRTGIVTDLTDTADICVIRTTFSPLTALPAEQPRGKAAGGRRLQVREPRVGYDAAATRLGLRVMQFEDRGHLRAWCADGLNRSLVRAIKRGRPEEIAATGVRRPVSASMVLIQFADGTGQQWVPMLSDGISRLAVCAAGLLGHFEVDPETTATAIAEHLPLAALTSSSPSHELARRMRRNHHQVVGRYVRHLDEAGADEEGVRMRQFLTLPANLHLLATDPATGRSHTMEPVMEAVVSDSHTGVDGWVPEDKSLHTALRALKRLADSGHIDSDLLELSLGRADLRTAPGLRPVARHELSAVGDANAAQSPAALEPDPGTDRLLLRRAVTLMATLLGPSCYPSVKSALKKASGRKRLSVEQTIEYLAPLVCEPWGTLKPITRAWAYGGPVPPGIGDTDLIPVHPADYLDLVDTVTHPASLPAVANAARLELALAGGTALLADGVMTTALVGGSGSAPAPLPYRGPVNAAVEALTRTEEGLVALAIAANHFRPSRSATSARLPAVDLDQPDRVARDGVGVPVRITETVLANYAAQSTATSGSGQPDPAAQLAEPTPLENLQARARHLPADTRNLLRGIELTKALHDETGGPSGLSEHDLDAVHDSLSQSLKLIGRLT